MLTLELRAKIDKLWNTFFANWLADPLTAIEQINYLIFMKRMDDMDRQNVIKAQRVMSLFLSERLKSVRKRMISNVSGGAIGWSFQLKRCLYLWKM